MKLTYKEIVGAKNGAIKLVDRYGWEKAACVFAKQGNYPGLCTILHGLEKGYEDLCRGRIWLCPSTKEMLESEYPSKADICSEIVVYG